MSMDIAVAAAVGLVLGATVAGVFLGNLAHQHYENYKAMKATAYTLEQDLLHEREGNTRPKYVLKGDAVDPYVTKNRPDVDPRKPYAKPELEVLDLTEVEEEMFYE